MALEVLVALRFLLKHWDLCLLHDMSTLAYRYWSIYPIWVNHRIQPSFIHSRYEGSICFRSWLILVSIHCKGTSSTLICLCICSGQNRRSLKENQYKRRWVIEKNALVDKYLPCKYLDVKPLDHWWSYMSGYAIDMRHRKEPIVRIEKPLLPKSLGLWWLISSLDTNMNISFNYKYLLGYRFPVLI